MDAADAAQAWTEMWLGTVLDGRRRERGPGLDYCERCGDDIPRARRAAVPGARRCIDCQERIER